MKEPKLKLPPIDAPRRRQLQQMAKTLGVKFYDIELLNVAFTHKSFAKENDKNYAYNERLEFLGDAVLELATSIYLYQNFYNLSEGELTKTRASIVCGPNLAKLANNLGFADMLIMGHGSENIGNRHRESVLENTFEAVIAAIYLDSGWEVAKDYVWRQFAQVFEDIKTSGNPIKDFKTTLQEHVQHQPGSTIEYFLINESGPDHDKSFECGVKINGELLGTGKGRSKQLAEKMAAEEALHKLNVIK